MLHVFMQHYVTEVPWLCTLLLSAEQSDSVGIPHNDQW